MKKSHSFSKTFVISPTPVLISLLISSKVSQPYPIFSEISFHPPETGGGNYERGIVKDVKLTHTHTHTHTHTRMPIRTI